jgi:hypothetical protein
MDDAPHRGGLPRTAVVVRRKAVDVDDVSRQGCSFRTAEPLLVGDIGLLSVSVAGQLHVQLFRVARAACVPGHPDVYEAGVEFLPMPASAPTLHELVAHLDGSLF